MKIKHLELTNFRGFETLDLTLDERLTILIAKNGAGKSSVLDALAINLGAFLTRLPGVSGINPQSTDFHIGQGGKKPPFMRVVTESFDGVRWDKTIRRDKTKRTSSQVSKGLGLKAINEHIDRFIDALNENETCNLPIFLHYGTGRGVFDMPERRRGFQKNFNRFSAYHQALESKTNFKRFVEYFYHLESLEDRLQKEQRSFDVELPELVAIRRALTLLMPEFSDPKTAYPAGIKVNWSFQDCTKELRIEQLSDGYRMVLVMVMDIASRMAAANPDADDPLLTEGMILIDEVDLHLHPSWQRDFLDRLIGVFPNVQFVVTTHSPFIVQSVKQGKLIDLDSLQSPYLEVERSVEDIAEQLMGLTDVQRSEHFKRQMAIASEYYRLLDEGIAPESEQITILEEQLDELEEKFGDNPAQIAFLKAERRKKLKQMKDI